MNQPEKNIDHIYRQRLANAEVGPPPKAWDQIASSLDSQGKSRKLIYYRKLVSIAAAVIIMLSVGIGFLINENKQIPDHVTRLLADSARNQRDSSHTKIQLPQQENLAEQKPESNNAVEKKTPPKTKILYATQDESKIPTELSAEKIILHPAQLIEIAHFILNFHLPPNLVHRDHDTWIKYLKQQDFNDLILDQTLFADQQAKDIPVNRWSVGGEFSPSANNLSGSGGDAALYGTSNDAIASLNHSQFAEENTNVYSGGLAVSYKLNDKWSLQSGLYYFKQGHEIQNFTVLSNQAAFNNTITSNSNSGVIEFTTPVVLTTNNAIARFELDANNQITQYNDQLRQQFEFIEIPFILKYKITNQKLGIYLLGGFDANILIRNNVYIGKSSKQSVGQTNNINSLIYKTALGFSIEYPISRNFYLNLSPVFKYQLTPISKEGAFNSTSNFIEYRTGISYRF